MLYWIHLLMQEFIHFSSLGLEIGGEINLAAAIQVAQLALKHRQNKKQQQRIVVFCGRYEQLFFLHCWKFILFVTNSPPII